MKFEVPKTKKLYEQIAAIIEHKITIGEISPGDKLDSVEQLAKNFEVGRSAIREALTALQARGIIEIRQGEGTYIRKVTAQDISLNIPTYASFSEQDLQQIFEVRKILELGLIENAAKRRTTRQLEQLEEALSKMNDALIDPEASSNADMQFHAIIAEAADNPLLVSMLQSVSKPIARQIQHTRSILSTSDHAALHNLHEEHTAIYNALVHADDIQAKEAMAKHLKTVESLLFEQ
ncbi:FadR/GntR family transcriptional regulator [Solibacillus sp. FSL R5-0691]|uniref:FadR/GntR family transcriptional regulator n=1 Tax=unclassified Solibacillus TaxID=2637870 RepID=UPI0030CF78EB